jgi:hypothetical protein
MRQFYLSFLLLLAFTGCRTQLDFPVHDDTDGSIQDGRDMSHSVDDLAKSGSEMDLDVDMQSVDMQSVDMQSVDMQSVDMQSVDMADDEDATLLDLELSPQGLTPTFAPLQTSYTSSTPSFIEKVWLTPTAMSAKATILVNGQPVISGMTSQAIPLSIGMNPIAVEVSTPSGSSMRYHLIVTRAALSIDYLKPLTPHRYDGFGVSTSLSGNTLAIGAPGDDSGGAGGDPADNSGSVYIFVHSPQGTWTQQARIALSNPETTERFGYSVSLFENTLAVGAYNSDSAGRVYVFERSPQGKWTPQARLEASNADPLDEFGFSVSLSGDTLAVGAPSEDSHATGVDGDQGNDDNDVYSGAVYLFTRSFQGSWRQSAYLKASNTGKDDKFGYSVSLSGDTLAVGARGEASKATGVNGDQSDESAPFSGAVYVFTRSPLGNWSQQAYLKASNTDRGDSFGSSVSLSRDTLAVGAFGESSHATGVNGDQTINDYQYALSGAVYVFVRSQNHWTQQAYLKASNTQFFGNFGHSVSLSGDTLAVGAVGDSSSATGLDGDQTDKSAHASGAVFVFTRTGNTWAQQAYVKASNTGGGQVFGSNSYFGDNFGFSLAVTGDFLAVGAPAEQSNGDPADNSANGSGAVYVY